MNLNTIPTKGNLILARNSLSLARQGYSILDKKRNILIQELQNLIAQAKDIQAEIAVTFGEAYDALRRANMDLGIGFVEEAANSVPIEDSLRIRVRSVMGVEIPKVKYEPKRLVPTYSFYATTEQLDNARFQFERVKELSIRLSETENSAFRLASEIRKTQKRANALKNITIPSYEALVKYMSDALEEKDREEFTRLKVIKEQMQDR